jgi:hypothetical protein
MKIQRKLTSKFFDEEINRIDTWWLDLSINEGEKIIYVSGWGNAKPFHELLNLLKNINKDYTDSWRSKGFGNYRVANNYVAHYLYFDEEWHGTRIFFSHNYDWSEQQLINIDVISNVSGDKPEVFLYVIKREDLFTNIFNLIEQNLEAYNLDCKKMFSRNEDSKYVEIKGDLNSCYTIIAPEEPIEWEWEYFYFHPKHQQTTKKTSKMYSNS